MPVFVRLQVKGTEARTLRLPDLPRRGETLELPGRLRVVVETIEPTPNDIVDAEVHARRTLWEPTDHASRPDEDEPLENPNLLPPAPGLDAERPRP